MSDTLTPERLNVLEFQVAEFREAHIDGDAAAPCTLDDMDALLRSLREAREATETREGMMKAAGLRVRLGDCEGWYWTKEGEGEWIGLCEWISRRKDAAERLIELDASLQQAREALRIAEEALRICYNVQEFPGDGSSTQDEALKVVRAALSEKETQAK